MGPECLDYGALGLAGMMMLSSMAFARWAIGKAFKILETSNERALELNSLVKEKKEQSQ